MVNLNQLIIKRKSGQFYLIVAIILTALIVGIVALSNFIKKDSFERIHTLEEEIKIESANVLDYSLYKGVEGNDFREDLSDFSQNYIENYKRNNDLYFLFGDLSNITLKGHQNLDKTVVLSSGLNNVTITNSEGPFSGSINPGGSNEILIYLDNLKYNFNLNSERNFYFILTERFSGSEYILTG